MDVSKPNGVKGYYAEIDSFFKVDFICMDIADGFGIGCHFNASGDVIYPGKSKDKGHINTQRNKDKNEYFPCFKPKIHFP